MNAPAIYEKSDNITFLRPESAGISQDAQSSVHLSLTHQSVNALFQKETIAEGLRESLESRGNGSDGRRELFQYLLAVQGYESQMEGQTGISLCHG